MWSRGVRHLPLTERDTSLHVRLTALRASLFRSALLYEYRTRNWMPAINARLLNFSVVRLFELLLVKIFHFL